MPFFTPPAAVRVYKVRHLLFPTDHARRKCVRSSRHAAASSSPTPRNHVAPDKRILRNTTRVLLRHLDERLKNHAPDCRHRYDLTRMTIAIDADLLRHQGSDPDRVRSRDMYKNADTHHLLRDVSACLTTIHQVLRANNAVTTTKTNSTVSPSIIDAPTRSKPPCSLLFLPLLQSIHCKANVQSRRHHHHQPSPGDQCH